MQVGIPLFKVLWGQRISACGNVVVIVLFHGDILLLSYEHHVSGSHDKTFVADIINVIHIYDEASMATQKVTTIQLVFNLAQFGGNLSGGSIAESKSNVFVTALCAHDIIHSEEAVANEDAARFPCGIESVERRRQRLDAYGFHKIGHCGHIVTFNSKVATNGGKYDSHPLIVNTQSSSGIYSVHVFKVNIEENEIETFATLMCIDQTLSVFVLHKVSGGP